MPKLQDNQNVSSNPRLTLVVATHQNHVNNHNELDTVCPHYNVMFGVHDIEPRHEVSWHNSKCVAVFTAMYIRPTVYTKYAVSLSLGWKIHRVTSIGIYSNISYLPESLNLLEASFLVHRAPFFRPKCLPLRGHVTVLTTIT